MYEESDNKLPTPHNTYIMLKWVLVMLCKGLKPHLFSARPSPSSGFAMTSLFEKIAYDMGVGVVIGKCSTPDTLCTS